MLSYLSLLRQRNFAFMTIADAVSVLGDQIGWVALLWFAMVTTKHSGYMGLLALAFGLPGVLFGAAVGNILDRFSHKKAIITANVLLGIVFMAIPLLYRLHALPMTVLFVLVFLAGCLAPFTSIGWMVIVPNLVKEEELGIANAVVEMIWNASMFLGPLISGLMITRWGAQTAVFADGISFWVSAVSILFIRYNPPCHELGDKPTQAVAFWKEVWDGTKLLYRMRGVWWLTLAALFINLAEGVLEVSLPLLTYRELSMTAAVLGTFWSVYFLTSIAGSMIGGILRVKSGKQGIVMSVAFIGWGISFVPLLSVKSALMVYLCMAVGGLLFAGYPLLTRTAVQRTVPKNYQGRIMGIRGSIISVGPSIGAYMGGILGQWFLASTVIGITGLAVVCFGLLLLSRRSFRNI